MENEIVVVNAIRGLCVAVNGFIQESKNIGKIHQGRRDVILLRIEAIKAMEKSDAIRAISNNNLKNIADITNSIQKYNFTGKSLEYALKQLETASQCLDKVLEDFTNGN